MIRSIRFLFIFRMIINIHVIDWWRWEIWWIFVHWKNLTSYLRFNRLVMHHVAFKMKVKWRSLLAVFFIIGGEIHHKDLFWVVRAILYGINYCEMFTFAFFYCSFKFIFDYYYIQVALIFGFADSFLKEWILFWAK